jgi:predicted DNA-binding protein with PD1-like motif
MSGVMDGDPRVHRSERSRHFVVRLANDEKLPDALLARLREERVTSGWLRASGVLADVQLRTFDARAGETGRLGPTRLLAGPVQALVVEGAIGRAGGALACSMRAVLAPAGDAGAVLGGEIETARTMGFEVLVTSLDDVALEITLDAASGVWLLAGAAPPPTRTWSSAVAAGEDVDPSRAAHAATLPARMPQKPARQAVDLDSPVPETGDAVEHFAFGPCEVVKSDGDRLHLRVQKDGRIKEIALEMLRVTPLDDAHTAPAEGDIRPPRRFKLDRRM